MNGTAIPARVPWLPAAGRAIGKHGCFPPERLMDGLEASRTGAGSRGARARDDARSFMNRH